MALLACAGCSKDDDGQQGLDDLASAKISIRVGTTSTVTKADSADPNELEGEANLNNLAVVVFDETGNTLLGSKWEEIKAVRSALLTDVPAKATKVRIVIVANIDREIISGLSTYDDFQARLVNLSSQSRTNLTMSSRVIASQSALVEGDNYLGYADLGSANIDGITSPILLTRLAARLDLRDIKTVFVGGELAGRSVRVNAVSVHNQKTASRYFSAAEWGAVEVEDYLADTDETLMENMVVSDDSPVGTTSYSHYVMENMVDEAHTQIAIRATILATDQYQAQEKVFIATINQNGLRKGYDHNFVKRNYVYRLHLSFAADSFDNIPVTPDPVPPTPPEPEVDTTSLSVSVEVVAWGEIDQDVII